MDDSSSDCSGRRRNQNTFSWSSTTSSLFSNSTQSTLSTENDTSYILFLDDFDTIEKKISQIHQVLCRAASHNDIQTIQHLVTNDRLKSYVQLNETDDNGSTPLIYASCFGHLQVVIYLLQLGAIVDIQDKIGWSALMWAISNNHDEVVKVLLEHSASSETKSQSGRTIYDLVDIENQHLVSLLSTDQHLQKRKKIKAELSYQDELSFSEKDFKSTLEFVWDQCLLDQMFVFSEDDLDHVLDVAISHLKLPMKSRSEIYVPVNIIFLSARYAHYFTSRELLNKLLKKSIERIDHVVKSNENDVHILAFWIANLSELLYYLKKDTGLVVATAEHQLNISELISETYSLLVLDAQKRFDRILESALLDYEQIDEPVDFAEDWHRFFRRSRFSTSSNSGASAYSSSRLSFSGNDLQQPIRTSLTPQSMMSLLSSTLYVLQSYDVHPVIVIQAISQLFHFLACELFNKILFNKKYVCRSRALQIRMNLTLIEEWIREHHLPTNLYHYFDPVIQLLQLLQCVSQLTNLIDFITTVTAFDALNPMQVKRIVLNYRYEVSEPRLPEEIEKYAMQIAEDTIKSIQADRQKEDGMSLMERTNESSRPDSISSLCSLVRGQKKSFNDDERCSISINEDIKDLNREWMIEKMDSKYMLPFSLPTTANRIDSGWSTHQAQTVNKDVEKMSLSDKIYNELKQKLVAKRDKDNREKSIIPYIPEQWLEKLDHHLGQY